MINPAPPDGGWAFPSASALSLWLVEHGPIVGRAISGSPPTLEVLGNDGARRVATWSLFPRIRGQRPLQEGEYVLATKYSDGDPGDHFVVGLLAGVWTNGDRVHYDIVSQDGTMFRGNGFRRIKRITPARGKWLIDRMREMEAQARAGSRRSVWGWLRLPMRKEASE